MADLTPAEKRILELFKRGHPESAVARTFGVNRARIREMKAAAEAKLGTARVAQGEEHWNR